MTTHLALVAIFNMLKTNLKCCLSAISNVGSLKKNVPVVTFLQNYVTLLLVCILQVQFPVSDAKSLSSCI